VSDGRDVHPLLGLLEGEAAQEKAMFPGRREASLVKGKPSFAPADAPSYYGLPVIQEPVWSWTIPAYFFTGGAAGAASVLAAIASLSGKRSLDRLVFRARLLAAGGTAVSTALLVYDLGKPARFLNMLRVLRPTSPMSVGSWVLAGSGATSGLAAVAQLVPGFGGLARAAGAAAGIFGLPLSGYTAVLLSNTVVPIWAGARCSLPVAFAGSAMASAASLLELLPPAGAERTVLRRFGLAGKALEIAASLAVEAEVASHAIHAAKPFKTGRSGILWKGALALTLSSLALGLVPGRSRAKSLATSVLAIAGALASRFAIHEAGKASAADPQSTFETQRRRERLEEEAQRPLPAFEPAPAYQ
jgi:formate-dependent nitrite reductase membrane component NrfD